MKIIIAGAGAVGFHLSKLLSYESQDITLIDHDKDSLDYADTHLDIKVIKGNAASIDILKEANVATADMLIAVTVSESTNITICMLAKQLGAKQTIARISNTEYIDPNSDVDLTRVGIDELISPESLATTEIELMLDQSAFSDTFEFDGGKLIMLATTLSENALFINKDVKQVAQLHPDLHFMPIALKRARSHATLIPRGDTVFKVGDLVYFVTTPQGVEELQELSAVQNTPVKEVMILGASKIGVATSKNLSENKHLNVKLIESSKSRAVQVAEELPQTMIIHGDGTNIELLEEEGIADTDVFIALTGHTDTNIISSLVAKSKGVSKTIAAVENMDYFELSHAIGIDTIINEKLLAADKIFRYIRKGKVIAMNKLNMLNAELLEFEVKINSNICGKYLKKLKIPRNAIIAGVIRQGVGYIALGDFKIEVEDRVLVCCVQSSIHDVERLFL